MLSSNVLNGQELSVARWNIKIHKFHLIYIRSRSVHVVIKGVCSPEWRGVPSPEWRGVPFSDVSNVYQGFIQWGRGGIGGFRQGAQGACAPPLSQTTMQNYIETDSIRAVILNL